MMSAADLQACRQKFVLIEGALEKEGITGSHFSCLKAKLDQSNPSRPSWIRRMVTGWLA